MTGGRPCSRHWQGLSGVGASVLTVVTILALYLTLTAAARAAFRADGSRDQSCRTRSATLTTPLPAEPSLYDVSSPDLSHCWAVGEEGTVLATSDGGAHWVKQDTGDSSYVLSAVCFPDQKHGWAVGEGGVVLATSDGGATWTKQTSGTTTHLKGVSFVDAVHGWAVGSNDLRYGDVILSTTNGGISWRVKEPKDANETYGLNAVDFVDGAHGWAAGQGGRILATANGGVTPAPSITKVSPAFAKRGALVTVAGAGFGASQSTSSVRFGSKACTTYVSWSDTQVKCRVPAKVSIGTTKVRIVTSAGTSNAVPFRVKR